jgi:heptosyltransferase-2
MAMPALQVLRERLHADAQLHIIARLGQVGLWRMHPAADKVLSLSFQTSALPQEIRLLKAEQFTHIIIIPNSFRSALLPALSRIPVRRGTPSQGRNLLINQPVALEHLRDQHQQWENAALMLPGPLPKFLPPPRLSPPNVIPSSFQGLPRPILALIPAAARGPSKQWPSERFLQVAQAWTSSTGGGTCWLGTPQDTALCESLTARTGLHSISLAGKTNLAEFTAVLQAVDAVLANDSGGMHLAAAVDTPVVAVFGKTDPRKTGPLHPEAVVIQNGGPGDRRIAHVDSEAQKALESVTVEQVLQPVLAIPASRR